jgi:hypothetical protein
MGLLSWLKRSGIGADNGIQQWRREWTRAVEAADAAAVGPLRARLASSPPLAEDLEIEEEMLDGLERLVAVTSELNASRLPSIETTHRVVGTDSCHFSAPVSMPDDPGQPSGRLLLTTSRAVFIGGAKLKALPWHAATQALQGDRDVLLVRADGQATYHFRCNTYADALCGAAIARHLIKKVRERRPTRERDL